MKGDATFDEWNHLYTAHLVWNQGVSQFIGCHIYGNQCSTPPKCMKISSCLVHPHSSFTQVASEFKKIINVFLRFGSTVKCTTFTKVNIIAYLIIMIIHNSRNSNSKQMFQIGLFSKTVCRKRNKLVRSLCISKEWSQVNHNS